MSFRNRCQVVGAEGMVDLSIPLAQGREQRTMMRDVRISGDWSWQVQHWRTIVTCYNRSPWFEHYRDGLERLYQRKVEFLLDWNLACFDWTVQALGWGVKVGLTERYEKVYAEEEAADWRGKLTPKNRAAGWEGMGDIGQAPRYQQVFEDRVGFIPNLSILDLLFCEGPAAIRYLQSP